MKRPELALIWKHGRVYSLANIVSRFAGLVLLPVYLHVLSPAEFGVLALVTLTTDVLGVVLGLGLGRALLRFYVGARDDAERDRLVASSLAMLLLIGAGFALLAVPVARLACWLIFDSQEHVGLFVYSNLAIVFTVLFNYELSCLLARKASGTYLLASLAKMVLMLSLNIVFVVHLEMGVLGVVLGTLVSGVLISGVLLIELIRGRRLTVSAATMRDMVIFAAPLIPSVLLDTVVAALDKLSINRLDQADAVGSYSTGQRLSALLTMFLVQPFMQIWVVRKLESLDHPETVDRPMLARTFDLFFILICSAALFVALFASEIISLIASEDYAAAATVIPLLALAEVLLVFRSYYEVGVFHANATRYLPFVALATLIFAVPAYGFLVKAFGVTGAAVAFALVAAVRVLIVAVVARRVSPEGADLRISVCFITAASAALAYLLAKPFLPETGGLLGYGLKAAVVLAYFALMTQTPAFGADGRGAVARFIRERRRGAASGNDTG